MGASAGRTTSDVSNTSACEPLRCSEDDEDAAAFALLPVWATASADSIIEKAMEKSVLVESEEDDDEDVATTVAVAVVALVNELERDESVNPGFMSCEGSKACSRSCDWPQANDDDDDDDCNSSSGGVRTFEYGGWMCSAQCCCWMDA